MSVDGLLSEVNALLGARLAIRAADQAFFGGKQVYTNVSSSTTCSEAAASAGCSDTKKGSDPLQSAIQNAKSIVDKALGGGNVSSGGSNEKVFSEIAALKKENQAIKDEVAQLRKLIEQLQVSAPKAASAAPAPAKAAPKEEAEEKDDDFDLFGSDDEEEDEEKKKVVEERLKAYNAKKANKPGVIAKSSVIMDVKPWDDETNLEELEANVRSIEMDGLKWGGGKLLPIGYGIRKLQIICVIEDLKVSVDDLIEKITDDFEDHVQSVDIVAFNKI